LKRKCSLYRDSTVSNLIAMVRRDDSIRQQLVTFSNNRNKVVDLALSAQEEASINRIKDNKYPEYTSKTKFMILIKIKIDL